MNHISSILYYFILTVTIALLLSMGKTSFAAGKPIYTVRVSEAGQSISSGYFVTDVIFDSEDYDVGGLHSTTVDPECLIVPLRGDGVYAISATASWGSGSTGFRFIALLVNGSVYVASNLVAATTSGNVQNVAGQFLLHAGDCVTLSVEQTEGANRSVGANLEMTFVAPGS